MSDPLDSSGLFPLDISSAPSTPQNGQKSVSDHFLVCGLGSLGQHCVANLKTFGVKVSAIELVKPAHWEVPDLPNLLEKLLVGDCCQNDVLLAAGVECCRAILLVTDNQRVNLEAALAARVLNPSIRLVVRSDKENLNQVLGAQLDNFVAFEPSQLSASAFALAAAGDNLLGYFQVGGYRFKVIKRRINPDHRWCDRRQLNEIDNRRRRLLRHFAVHPEGLSPTQISDSTDPSSASAQFYTWLPNTTVRAGDTVITLEVEPAREPLVGEQKKAPRRSLMQNLFRMLTQWQTWPRAIAAFWRVSYGQQIRRVAILCGLTIFALVIIGTGLFWLYYPRIPLPDAFYATVTLLLGGYGDLFGDLNPTDPLPWWIRLFSLSLTLAGTAFIGVLYALLTEKLLTIKFQFLTRRPPVPQRHHAVIIGLGQVGRRVMSTLKDLQQPAVAITSHEVDAEVLPQLPIIVGETATALEQANLHSAKSIIAVGEDEVQNLEMGLMAYRANPRCRLIIRAYDQRFSDKVAQLFPYARVLCASALSAEAFAGAAFGENVLSLFPLYNQTILVTQYTIEAADTLSGLLLSEMAYGYGVVPILYQHPGSADALMPSDDTRLQEGDRLLVLATIRGLRRIEQGKRVHQQWQVAIDRALTQDAQFDGASEIACVAGCDISEARRFMENLPGTFPKKLYRHQALRLVRQLLKRQVQARMIAINHPNLTVFQRE
ncbi:MAG: NAD-binding protein [Cyanobacteria bacterium P01_C01_bin.73]